MFNFILFFIFFFFNTGTIYQDKSKTTFPDWILNEGFEGFISLDQLKSTSQFPINIDAMYLELQEYYRVRKKYSE
jgi:hypothetical protein